MPFGQPYNSEKKVNKLFEFYQRYFDHFKPKGKVLEIGVHNGGSLEWLRDQGIFDTVVGIDINEKCGRPAGCDVHIINQLDRVGLDRLAKHYGGFDVIIDDGAHVAPETRCAFETLWPWTRSVYFIEDWSVGYGQPQHSHGMLTFVGELITQLRALGGTEVYANYNKYHTVFYIKKG